MMTPITDTPTLGKHALALIRLIISSYFIAIGLGLIDGISPGIVFRIWMDPHLAEFLGDSIMLGASLFIFFGLYLRFSCLYLAMLVLSATLVQNVFWNGLQNVDALWRDVVMVSVLLLIYGSLSRRALNTSALVKRKHKVRSLRVQERERIVPRRIGASAKDPGAKLSVIQFADIRARLRAETDFDEDMPNIFCDLDVSRT